MHHRQRGTLNLFWLAVFCAAFAGVAMAALFSMRYERNLFAEGWAKVRGMAGASPAAQVVDNAREAVGAAPAAPAGAPGQLRRCTINGKTVLSDTECSDQNPTSRVIKAVNTQGIEAPKAPPKEDTAAKSDPMLDKAIDKQLK